MSTRKQRKTRDQVKAAYEEAKRTGKSVSLRRHRRNPWRFNAHYWADCSKCVALGIILSLVALLIYTAI